MKQLERFLHTRIALRVHSVALTLTLIAGVAAIGPVGSRGPAGDNNGTGTPDPSFVDGSATPDPTAEPTAGRTGGPTAVPSSPGGVKFVIPGGRKPVIPASKIPHFGLKTQGISNRGVKVGISYNVASCGDSAFLQAMLGAGVAGDMKKAIEAYSRYINDTGGIGGKDYIPVIVDDGGSGCPEKNIAAAVKMAEEEKVFMAIPGLHVESDYIMSKYKIPVFGGREDPASLAKYGPNGLQILEPMEPTFKAWASFGRHYFNSKADAPCLLRIETGAAGDFDTAERILVKQMTAQGLKFLDIWVFKDDVSTAQEQSSEITADMRDRGCKQVWFMAGNPIGLIFFTDAATQAGWFPKWTFTALTVLTDTELAGNLMDPLQWENAVGLSIRVPAGHHRNEGNCKRIYEQYNGNDGQSESASAILACATILPSAEMMRRAVALTGTLNADTLLLGANAITNDFFYDATVPMDWKYPSASGPFKTRGFSHYTVVDWSSTQKKYVFPTYPCYYIVFGPNNGGCDDLTRYYGKN